MNKGNRSAYFSSGFSDLHDKAIVSTFQRDLIHPFENFTPNMTQQQSLTTQPVTFRSNARVADMEEGLGLKIATLTDKKVRALRITNEVLIPSTISRI